MYDYHDLEQDYVRRLREAQERGDSRPVPLIDESRVRYGKIISVAEVIDEAFKLLTIKRPDGHLGAVAE